MNSSVKFLLPTTIVGFACGFAEAAAVLPPKTIATPNEIANAAFAARRVCLRIMLPPPGMDALPGKSLWDGGLSRRGGFLHQREEHGGEERQGGDAERGGEDTRIPVAGAVDDDRAEPAAARDGGDRRGRDDEDRRDPDAGEDERQRERELDAHEHPELRHPHPPRRVDHVAIDRVDGEVRVRQNRRHGEDDERDGVVPEADAEHRDAERDQDEARQRAPDVRHAGGEEQPTMEVTEPEADRQREQQPDPECGAGQLEMLGGLHEQEVRVVADEPERVDERVHADLPNRTQGVSARWRRTSRPSATSARATTIPPAMKISVLKTSWPSAVKIGAPRPFATTNDATVAIETVETVAMRRPARIVGSASGSSTRVNVWIRVNPEPRATSTISAGT